MVPALDMPGTLGAIRVWILGRGGQTATQVRRVGQERDENKIMRVRGQSVCLSHVSGSSGDVGLVTQSTKMGN